MKNEHLGTLKKNSSQESDELIRTILGPLSVNRQMGNNPGYGMWVNVFIPKKKEKSQIPEPTNQ